MPFIWAGCMDGSSIDLSKLDALIVGQVQQHDSDGKPMFTEGITAEDGSVSNKEPILQMCVFGRIGVNDYPIGLANGMHDAQVKIQSLLGKLKQEYDKERGVVQIASAEEKKVLKI